MKIKKKHVEQIHEALSAAFWAEGLTFSGQRDYLIPTGSDAWKDINEALELITQYKIGRI